MIISLKQIRTGNKIKDKIEQQHIHPAGFFKEKTA